MKENEMIAEEKESRSCLSRLGGCLGTVVMVILAMCVSSLSKQCGRQAAREYQGEKDAYVYNHMTPDERLKKGLQEMGRTLPHRVDDLTMCTNIELDDNFFTYVYEVDSSIDFSETNFNTFDRETRIEIAKHQGDMQLVIDLCRETNRLVRYKYVSLKDSTEHYLVMRSSDWN